MKNIIQLLLFLFISTQIIAQPGRGKQSGTDNYQIAQELLAESSYYNATGYLIKALESKGNKDVNLIYLIAETYRKARDYENAAYYYSLTIKQDAKGKFKNARYSYALMLKQSGNYEKAIEQFEFIESLDNEQSEWVESEIEGCDLALSGKESEIISLEEMAEVNTNYSEYAPMPLKNGGFIYSSLHSDELIYTHDKMVYSKIFETSINNGNVTNKGTPMSDLINIPELHNGHGTYSDNGNQFYFTRCETASDHLPKCKIYVSDFKNKEWSEARELGFNINGEGTASNPYFKNGELYFTSDREDGFGGLDIWSARLSENGSFLSPINLGEEINTEGDEITPCVVPSNDILYFSSNGHAGYGGFDIFQAIRKNGKWTDAANMYQPINSSADDMYFVVDESLRNGYFSSNRAGAKGIDNATCCDDIFAVRLANEAKNGNITVQGFAYLNGNRNGNPMDDVTMELYESDMGELKLVDTRITKNQTPYLFNLSKNKEYIIKASKPGYQSLGESVKPRGTRRIYKDLAVSKRDCIDLNGYVYENDLKDKIISEGARIKITEIDQYGNETVLSETLSTVSGYGVCIPKDKNMKMTISKEGYLTDSYNLNTIGVTEPQRFDIFLKQNNLNAVFRIDNILYDFNSSVLRPESKKELEKIYKIMMLNPRIILEIGSHTDNKGTVDYNLALSEKRAKSVLDLLVSKGIPMNRLKHKGYGELQFLAPNRHPDGSDNPAGRQLNRRTEFKIIGILDDMQMSRK